MNYRFLKSSLFILVGLLLLSTCEEQEEEDTTPPTVTITSPQNGSTVNELVTITCISTDNEGVEKVELWIDGVSTGVIDKTEPYSLEWNTTSYENKSYTVTVRSYDVNENMSDSDPITLIVDNSVSNPQSISITSLFFENGGFNIVWNKSIDGDFGSYELEKSVESTMSNYEIVYSTENVTDTTFVDNDVDPLNYQYYRITVIDTFGYESKSQIISSSLDPVPTSINISSVTYTLYEMEVEWDESQDDDFRDYKLLYSDSESGEKDTLVTSTDKSVTSYIITNFNPTHENWFWILVSDTLGQSSIGRGMTHIIDSSPTQINISSVTYDLTEMVVTWETSIDNDFISYELLYSESKSGEHTSLITVTDISTISYSITNFDPTLERWYWIRVTDYWGLTTVSNGYMVLDSLPTPSELFPIVYNNGSFLITWSQNYDDDFLSYTLYESFSSDMSGSNVIYSTEDITDTTFVVTGINEDEYIYYQIVVKDVWELTVESLIVYGSSFQKITFQRIVYNPDERGEIYIVDINGLNETRLTNNNVHDLKPKFSPDGTKIAFSSNRDGTGEIYIMDTNGNNQTRLTTQGGNLYQFSPDGTKILFNSYRDGNSEIYTMNTDGTNQTRLTFDNRDCEWATFSRDGSKIVFVVDSGHPDTDIHLMNVDGSDQVDLSNNEDYDRNPKFTFDGNKIIYLTDRDGNWEIYSMDIDGSNQTNLTNSSTFEDDFTVSPTNSLIIYRTNRDGNINLWKMRTDGSNQQYLTNSEFQEFGPVFSPNGLKIAFNRDVPIQWGFSEIFIIDIDGVNEERITNNSLHDYYPVFQPRL